ncbi:aldose 1-epimerase family protein [Devosia rhodophyticola]|uniref:Aldose 1-epimerase family protein n=1 Tax=Devosia rhodophyticola TaxID=3026423 RepID=A0ABY7YUD0_9HYPH|nr:aldose 1-epimerase family protein [Devosia rhodophyticola]WDR04861.1 aldose 1-epimerase family protein [Devosia rhodophyticola]
MEQSVQLDNGQISIEIAAMGAEMQSITGADGRSWLWHGDEKYWTGRAPVLFPIVGKTPNDMIGIGGKDYAMASHGFARRRSFELVEADADHCIFKLEACDETLASYPFQFRLQIEYRLIGAGVAVTGTVTNLGANGMPFQFGYHPAFVWPLPGAEGKVHEIRLSGDAAPALQRLRNGLLTTQRQPSPFRAGRLRLEPGLFAEDAMIFSEGAGESLVYGVAGGQCIEFSWTGLPNLALWTKRGAPFLCIEPWHGTAAKIGGSNDIMHRPYALMLKPGVERVFGYKALFKH